MVHDATACNRKKTAKKCSYMVIVNATKLSDLPDKNKKSYRLGRR